jgi:hypothetical protein
MNELLKMVRRADVIGFGREGCGQRRIVVLASVEGHMQQRA